MGIYADLGRAIAANAEGGPPVRVSIYVDADSTVELHGEVTAELSDTHVRIRSDDGLVFAAAKTDLTFLPGDAP